MARVREAQVPSFLFGCQEFSRVFNTYVEIASNIIRLNYSVLLFWVFGKRIHIFAGARSSLRENIASVLLWLWRGAVQKARVSSDRGQHARFQLRTGGELLRQAARNNACWLQHDRTARVDAI